MMLFSLKLHNDVRLMISEISNLAIIFTQTIMSSAAKKRKLADASASSESSKSDPSTFLRNLSTSIPPDAFIKLLENQLYPVLDSLPPSEKVTLLAAFTRIEHESLEAQKSQKRLDSIGYEAHRKSLTKGLKDLTKHINRNWKTGWQEQGEMMGEIGGEVLDWLPTLWKVGVHEGREIELIRRSLVLCTETFRKLTDCGSQSDLEDMDGFEVSIKDEKGTLIFEAPVMAFELSLPWMWRELLVKATASKDAATKAIEADIAKLKLKEEVLAFIRADGGKLVRTFLGGGV